MYKKKKHTTAATAPPEPDPDELSLVKAAAWAWHQHSSSPKNKQTPPSEFPLATNRHRFSHRPSRYRLESLSKSNPTTSPVQVMSEKMTPVTLLDLYEMERIRRELERFMAASERREKVQSKKVQMRKSTVVGCLLGRHATAVCGSRGSAVETDALVGQCRERST